MKKLYEMLVTRRHELGLSLEEVAKKTRIPLEQLKKIEEGKWETLNSYAYLLGMVQKYAAYLRISPEKVSALFKREINDEQTHFIREKKYKDTVMHISPQLYFFSFLLLFVFLFAIQLIFFWQKPLLTLFPSSRAINKEDPFVIRGTAEPGALLYLNEQRVYQDEKGGFREELYLKKGNRRVDIKVIGTNGRVERKTVEILVK